MKTTQYRVLIMVLGVFLIFGLSGCKTLQDLGIDMGSKASYEPMSNHVTRMASPNTTYDVTAYCQIANGEANFHGHWKPFAKQTFKLPAHERVDVPLKPKSGQDISKMQAYFDYEGQKILFCPFIETADPGAKIPCASLYMLEDDLKMGLKRTFDVPDAVVRGAITCADTQGHLLKL